MSRDPSLKVDQPPLPEGPTGLPRRDYRAVLKSTFAEISDDDVPSLAAGVAFRIFLSIFPALIAAVAIFSLVTTEEDMARFITVMQNVEFLPEAANDLVIKPLENLVEGDGAAGIAVAGVLGGLWAATSAAVTLIKALSRAWDVPESRSFFVQRAVALVIMVALVLALAGLFLLLVVGVQIQAALLPEGLNTGMTGALLGLGRFVAAVALLMLLFAFVYWVGPDRDRPHLQWLSPGAVVAVVGWLAASGLFTFYVRTFGDYEATYGALAGVIVLLLWLQISMMTMLIGAELNAEVERAAEIRSVIAEGAGFAQAAPLAEAASWSPDPGAEPLLPAARPGPHPLPGLEERGRRAGSDGASGVVARAGAAAAAGGTLMAIMRHRRRQRGT